jgi:gliding motility-associated-like protein
MKKILLSILILISPFIINTHRAAGSNNLTLNNSISASLGPYPSMQAYTYDFGDAPESYGSASHYIVLNTRWLGSQPDGEADQQYSSEADGDDLNGIDDEDGVTFPEMIQGATVNIRYSVTGSARLNAWIDWNGDGDFSDLNEKVANNVSRTSGNYTLSVTVPANAIASKPVFARFRYGPNGLSSTGSTTYGEVEDYMIKIICATVDQPKVSSITQPSCEVPSGSVVLEGLPSSGTWILTRMPGAVITKGTGTSTTISGLEPGTWTYTVTNESGCTSDGSENIIILPIPLDPAAPVIDSTAQPTCTIALGLVYLSGLPENGTWTLTRHPNLIITKGTGTTTIVTGLEAGTYFFTVANAEGCTSTASANAVINPQPVTPAAPAVGTIMQPTCALPEGSVILQDLPATGTWTLTRMPGGTTTTGTGTSTTITGLLSGTWNYTVTNASGCISGSSADIVILPAPASSTVPVIDTIIQPTCTVSTGRVILTGLPATGTWTLTRYPDGATFSGSGISTTITGLEQGTYNFTVTNSDGCISGATPNVVINQQPPTPAVPVPGAITHPTCQVPGGTVVLNGLPASGVWTLTRLPGSITSTGTGTSTTVSGLESGMYNFYVTNSEGCPSPVSANVVINPRPGPVPTVKITNPKPVCTPATVDITDPAITAGSTGDLTYSYWLDIVASIPYNTPAAATDGTYYIKGTTASGCSDIQPVIVTVYLQPISVAGPDQVLEYQFNTTLDADVPDENLTGGWSVVSGSGHFADTNYAKTIVTNLAVGENILQWAVNNGVCPPALDNLLITVHDLLIPTLITPNNDGLNDYFYLQGLAFLGKTVLTVFDRRGVLVFESTEYDNLWDGIDYNGNPLPDDTYFFILEPENRIAVSGYVVIRRQ